MKQFESKVVQVKRDSSGIGKATAEARAMIATFVSFRYGDDFDEQRVRKAAAAASPQFSGMPGLRSKLFSVTPGRREATNVYVWDSEEAARAFFNEELRARVTGIYGVAPTVEFAEVAAVVENH